MQRDYYHYLSGFGIHPGRIPQSFGDKLLPSVGGLFRLRGLTIVLDELAYVISMVGGTGAVLLSDDERIPGWPIRSTQGSCAKRCPPERAAVALIDDHQVKEVGRELLVDVVDLFRTSDRLIERQVDLEAFVNDFGAGTVGWSSQPW